MTKDAVTQFLDHVTVLEDGWSTEYHQAMARDYNARLESLYNIRAWARTEALEHSWLRAPALTTSTDATNSYGEIVAVNEIQQANAEEAYDYAVTHPPGDDDANEGGDIGGDVALQTAKQLSTESLVAAAQAVCPCAAWRLVRVIQAKSTVWHQGNDHLADTSLMGLPIV